MRSALVVVLVAGLAAAAFALLQPPAGQPANQPAEPPPVTLQPPPPPAPTPVPVPDLPIVKKQELEGGLIVEDMKIGDGYEVKANGAVVALYHGMLKADGKVFDSAFTRGEPVAFPLNGVIEGWQKGVPGMKVGGIRKLTIPAQMGYGERGAGAEIPPNSDLVFIIQLTDALQVEDVQVGTGEEASGRTIAVTNHVIKDTDGKELEKSTGMFVWLPGEYQPMDFGVAGMKVGGKRRLLVPKEMAQGAPGLTPEHPTGVPVSIEFELVALRNLPMMRR